MDQAVIISELTRLATEIETAVKASLIAKGHVATGNLRDSIKLTVRNNGNSYDITGVFLPYGHDIDRGAPPQLVPLNNLIEWMRLKHFGLTGEREISIAKRIQRNIYQRGTPSNPGKYPHWKGFVSDTLRDKSEAWIKQISDMGIGALVLEINNMVKQAQQQINTQNNLAL